MRRREGRGGGRAGLLLLRLLGRADPCPLHHCRAVERQGDRSLRVFFTPQKPVSNTIKRTDNAITAMKGER